MARRAFIVVAVAALAFAQIALAQDTQDPQATLEHKGSRGFLDYSPLNRVTGLYAPIGSDKSHLYYRIPVTLNVVDYYRTSPLAPALALTQAAASGPVLAGLFTEDIEVGSFKSLTTQMNNVAGPGSALEMLSTFSISFGRGPVADTAAESLVATGGWTYDPSIRETRGQHLAITGGTGRFIGAMGEITIESGALNDDRMEAVIAFAVPYVNK